MKGLKINLKDFQEVFYSEEHQVFCFKNTVKNNVSASFKSFWVCRKTKFQDFLEFVKPLTENKSYISFEFYNQLLDTYLENVQKADAFLVAVKQYIRVS